MTIPPPSSPLGPTLTTARLHLCPPRAEDFDGFAAMMVDADHVRFVGGGAPRAQAWRLWAALAGSWVLRGFGMFSMIHRETGAWIGRAGPWAPEGWPGNEVGWGVARVHAGQGYAHEAAVASIDWAFDHLRWEDVIHVIDPANARSIALARRLGSVNRGPTRLPEPLQDLRVDAWGQTREQWLLRRSDRRG